MSKEQVKELTLKKYYRAKEVAELIGCSLSQVWKLSKDKKLTAIHLSPRITVFHIDDINSLFDEVA